MFHNIPSFWPVLRFVGVICVAYYILFAGIGLEVDRPLHIAASEQANQENESVDHH